MTWPSSDVNTTAMDSGTDTPPRAEIKSWADKFNEIRNHVGAFMQGLLDDADAPAARLTLGFRQCGFSAAASAARTTTGTFGTYATEHFDLGGDFNTTSGVFTAPVAGVYQFNAIVQGTNTATSNFTASFNTNGYGSPAPYVQVGSAASGHPAAVLHAAVRMAAGNTCKVDLSSISNTGWAPVVSHFSGFLAMPE